MTPSESQIKVGATAADGSTGPQSTSAFNPNPTTVPPLLEEIAKQSAQHQPVRRHPGRTPWLGERLQAQIALIDAVYQSFASADEEQIDLPHAAEWMLDNYYLVRRAARQIQEDLPRHYYSELPKLSDGPLDGYPRVYAIAVDLLCFGRGHLVAEQIERFALAYQQVSPLAMGEVWALPIMLRLALIEMLAQALARLTDQEVTDDGPAAALAPLREQPADDLVAGSIVGLRLLDVQDWAEFFERVSAVEAALRAEPTRVYPTMTFATRDQYRRAVEEIARWAAADEVETAQRAIERAVQAGETQQPVSPRAGHVGYYLLDAGRVEFETEMGCRVPWRVRAGRWLRQRAAPLTLGAIAVLTIVQVLILIRLAGGAAGLSAVVAAMGIALVTLLPALDIAVNLIIWLVTRVLPPSVLPKLDFRSGVADHCRTMVVVPALLTSQQEVTKLLRDLELHYLSNPDPNLGFALLLDYGDAPQAAMPDDDLLWQAVADGVAALNQRYPRRLYRPFFAFLRARRWNSSEGVWMGWERKRGKLSEFNHLILGETETSYIEKIGDLAVLSSTKYIITLDADTVLPNGSAQRLIGTMAHPLNRPELSPETGLVTTGYAILQPRVSIRLTSTTRSRFAGIYAGDTGLDLYSRAVSDFYQDLFGEGVYVGKGIYDVAVFERSLHGRVPENALLSHDLFEGLHARAALVSDVVVYEDYPASYLVHMRRLHRWIRGDWQLLPWLGAKVPVADGSKISSPLSLVARWKLWDNLRRSLLAPALLLLLIAGWLWLPGAALGWTLYAILVLLIPLLVSLINELSHRTLNELFDMPAASVKSELLRRTLTLVFLPYAALIDLDAIASTLVRLTRTHRHLLQWVTMDHTMQLFGKAQRMGVVWMTMAGAPITALVVALLLFFTDAPTIPIAAPFLLAWFISPAIAYWISQPRRRVAKPVTPQAGDSLRAVARRTWMFYESFVGPEDNWLPPDHFQERPVGRVAHRTSPTNIGLTYTSFLAAFDFGYVGLAGLVARLQTSFETLDKMERHRGHFLNWYATQSLEPLPPRYVSTVDSGNLAASLIVVQQACYTMPRQPILRWSRWLGLLDVFTILEATAASAADSPSPPIADLHTHLQSLRAAILALQLDPTAWIPMLMQLDDKGMPALMSKVVAIAEQEDHRPRARVVRSLHTWTERAANHVKIMHRELERLLPAPFPPVQPAFFVTLIQTDAAFADDWDALMAYFRGSSTLEEAPALCHTLEAALSAFEQRLAGVSLAPELRAEALQWCSSLSERLVQVHDFTERAVADYADVAARAGRFVNEMDFSFLFDEQRELFHIGYNLDNGRLDDNYYDLLASEARLTSLLAIAKRDVPYSHWMHLSRAQTQVDGRRCLLSWSGTMFEYLMPRLFTRVYQRTLLSESDAAAVHHQIAYGRRHQIPWGMSESGFYRFDANQNLQYQAFGVPGLGFKRGLEDDLVITPYASALALPIAPDAVLENFTALTEMGMLGDYGYYEAVDFTSTRVPVSQAFAIVRSFMAHHQGMTLLSIDNFLNNDAIVRRFHADPRIQSMEILLQEMIPVGAPTEYPQTESESLRRVPATAIENAPWAVPARTPAPLVHVLTNGSFTTLLTNAGGGYSQWHETALTRWRSDLTLDNYGQWLYLHDRTHGESWSLTAQPICPEAANVTVQFYPHKVEYRCAHREVAATVEVTVAPQSDVEIRRVTIVNQSKQPVRLALISYGEVILSPQASDRSHPAFNKLFVDTEAVPDVGGLLFRRRLRAADEQPIWMVHCVAGAPPASRPSTNIANQRAAFLGRGRTVENPQALENAARPLAFAPGATLDPIFAISHEFSLGPYASVEVCFVTTVAEAREDALSLARRFRDRAQIERSFEQARGHGEQTLRRLEAGTPFLAQAQRLLSALLYAQPALRARPEVLEANQLGQSGLWPFAISGDYPILLVLFKNEDELAVVSEALRAHRYWRDRLLMIDLVLVNSEALGYSHEAQSELMRMLARTGEDEWLNRRGGIFVLNQGQLRSEDWTLLQSAARVIIEAAAGPLAQQLERLGQAPVHLPLFAPPYALAQIGEPTPALPRPAGLLFDNGIGGFSPDGRQYQIYLRPKQVTPAPWINVIANPEFGFLISALGATNSWAINSGENRLTGWNNDATSESTSEAIYLRDEETGVVWSPTPLPCPAENTAYSICHGPGYSTFTNHSYGLQQELQMFAATDARVKIMRLQLHNVWSRVRRITVTFYAEWVLGTQREQTQAFLVQEFEASRQALLARNAYNTDFAGQVAFAAASQPLHGLTCDRTEFLGNRGTNAHPAALARIGLSGNVTPGGDPCAALQIHVDLQPGEQKEVYFLLGQGDDRTAALDTLDRFLDPAAVENAWHAVHDHWEQLLGTITVETPDRATNLMLNHWLLYQAIACRLWGRSAFYQSSGAYGFRDQLQDAMALVFTAPHQFRQQILRSAQHQFEAGDVLHWWHPPADRGVRTRISDDLLWLPYVTAYYVRTTGDEAILKEKLSFLRGEPLAAGEDERYAQYQSTAETYTLYEHCRRAIRRGSTAGQHGLPLIGTGDWNDGMNRVGIGGKGESIWLGWFLYDILTTFAPISRSHGDEEMAIDCERRSIALRGALEAQGWDGAWYRRAYYDDGAPLGSTQNAECRIDSIAQSWAVLSGAADAHHAAQAMDALYAHLAQPSSRLLQLFAPAFDKTPRDPGYIKGYPPGIRENGGQYTHAAVWSVWAFAALGDGDRAGELFGWLNPITHGSDAASISRYQIEPYVLAGDVYSVKPHAGRGGWSWYTGSAGWLYRFGIEGMLGIQRAGPNVRVDPCIPSHWSGLRVILRCGSACYTIQVRNPNGKCRGLQRLTLDGAICPQGEFPYVDDGGDHAVEAILG